MLTQRVMQTSISLIRERIMIVDFNEYSLSSAAYNTVADRCNCSRKEDGNSKSAVIIEFPSPDALR